MAFKMKGNPFKQMTIGEQRKIQRQGKRRDRKASKGKLPNYEGNLHWFQE
tara:strand:+ start:257 stop:406 length:150 start_codon:yes stop_codon:yes gene_type:complete